MVHFRLSPTASVSTVFLNNLAILLGKFVI